MSAQRLLQWLRALLRPAPLLGVAMIGVMWFGLFYLLSDHHGSLSNPEQRRSLFLPIVSVLTLLQLIIMAASIRRQLSVEETNLRFNTALENLTHGLCMFDGDKRLVVWNERYAGLYRLPPEFLKVGTRHEEIIGHRVQHGILKGETSAGALNEKLGALDKISSEEVSSRCFSVMSSWVATQPPPLIGCRVTRMSRPSASSSTRLEILLDDIFSKAPSFLSTAPALVSPLRMPCRTRWPIMSSCVAPTFSNSGGRR